MSPVSTSPQSLRAQAGVYLRQVDWGQMDWARGVRAGLALCAPLVLGDFFPFHDLAWASLGGLMAIAADSGGAYRTRLSSLIVLILGGGSGIILGSLVAGHLVWALPAVLIFCFLWNYLAVLGEAFASAQILIQVLFFATLGQPLSSLDAIFHRAALVLAGNLWAVVLALLLWPQDAYRPVRMALSACYEDIAAFLGAMGELSGNAGQTAAEWHELSVYHPARIRRAIEEGWRALAAIRSLHSTESARGRQSVVLLELADLLVLRSIALAEHLEFIAAGGDSSCRDCGLTGIDQLSSTSLWIASLLQRRRGQGKSQAAERLRQMGQLPSFSPAVLPMALPSAAFFSSSSRNSPNSSRPPSRAPHCCGWARSPGRLRLTPLPPRPAISVTCMSAWGNSVRTLHSKPMSSPPTSISAHSFCATPYASAWCAASIL